MGGASAIKKRFTKMVFEDSDTRDAYKQKRAVRITHRSLFIDQQS